MLLSHPEERRERWHEVAGVLAEARPKLGRMPSPPPPYPGAAEDWKVRDSTLRPPPSPTPGEVLVGLPPPPSPNDVVVETLLKNQAERLANVSTPKPRLSAAEETATRTPPPISSDVEVSFADGKLEHYSPPPPPLPPEAPCADDVTVEHLREMSAARFEQSHGAISAAQEWLSNRHVSSNGTDVNPDHSYRDWAWKDRFDDREKWRCRRHPPPPPSPPPPPAPFVPPPPPVPNPPPYVHNARHKHQKRANNPGFKKRIETLNNDKREVGNGDWSAVQWDDAGRATDHFSNRPFAKEVSEMGLVDASNPKDRPRDANGVEIKIGDVVRLAKRGAKADPEDPLAKELGEDDWGLVRGIVRGHVTWWSNGTSSVEKIPGHREIAVHFGGTQGLQEILAKLIEHPRGCRHERVGNICKFVHPPEVLEVQERIRPFDVLAPPPPPHPLPKGMRRPYEEGGLWDRMGLYQANPPPYAPPGGAFPPPPPPVVGRRKKASRHKHKMIRDHPVRHKNLMKKLRGNKHKG